MTAELIKQHRRVFAAEYETNSEPVLHPAHCGPCEDCAAFLIEQPVATNLVVTLDEQGRPVDATVTLEQFIAHARKFGSMCVMETALEMGLGEVDLAKLQIVCLEVEATRKAKSGRRRHRSRTTAEIVLALKEQGLVVSAIADRLCVTDLYVQRVLRESRTSEKRPANPHGYAAISVLSPEARVNG